MSKISDLAKNGIYYQPLTSAAPPAEEDGDTVRGFKKAMYQIPQTIGGTIALAGDAIGSQGMMDYGMDVYENQNAKIQKVTKDSDSLTNVLQGDESAVDWVQNAAGYVGGQALSAIATGGAGGFIGSQLAKRGIKSVVDRGAQSMIAREVAGKVAARGAKIGAGTALFGSNLTQEAGSIYPEARHVAEEDGRGGVLSGGDLARVAGSAVVAAGVDTGMDMLMLGRVMKGGRKEGETMLRAGAREVPMAMAREGVTEGIQTGIERYGARQELGTADAIRDYVDSIGVGMVGGGLGGAASVLRANKVPEAGSLTRAANAGIEDQILQLTNDPQPLIAFPDGSVGTKSELEAYLNSKYPDAEDRLAARREIMGRDPATGKRPEPEPAEEQTSEIDEVAAKQNLEAWGAQHDPVTHEQALALLNAPGLKGKGMMVVPHPAGDGYTLAPSKDLTLEAQADAAPLQKPIKEEPAKAAAPMPAAPAFDPATANVDDEVTRNKQDAAKAPPKAPPDAEPDLVAAPAAPKPKPGTGPVSIMNKAGQPFMTEFSAKRALKDGYADTHEITAAAEGGFILTPKEKQDAAVPAPIPVAGGSNQDTAATGKNKRKGTKKAVQEPGKPGSAAAAPVGTGHADPVHADPATDPQPALTADPSLAADPYKAYKFAIEGGATAFMGKKKIDPAKFEPVKNENGSWSVVPRAPSKVDAVAGKTIDSEWTAFAPESGTIKVERAAMPQIKAEHRGAMVNFLAARGIKHAQEEVPAASLKPTQREFSQAKVQQARDFVGGDRSILVSSDNHILDGHHQWLAKMDDGAPVKVIRLDAPINDLMGAVAEFPSAQADATTEKTNAKNDDVPAAGNATQPGAADRAGAQPGGSAAAAEPTAKPVPERDVSDQPASAKEVAPGKATPQDVLREAGKLSNDLFGGNHPSVIDVGTADGTFAGSGTLNMDDDGNVVLQRVADHEGHLTKNWESVGTQELMDTSLSHGGGRGLPTSGFKDWTKSFGTTRQGTVTGTFRIPHAEFLAMIKRGDAVLGNIGEGEVVLNPAAAKQYLAEIDGKKVAPPATAEANAAARAAAKAEKLPPTDIRIGDKLMHEGREYEVSGPVPGGVRADFVAYDKDGVTQTEVRFFKGDDAIRAKIAAEKAAPAPAEPAAPVPALVARNASVLDKPSKLDPSAGLGTGTRREAMQKAIEQERAFGTRVTDTGKGKVTNYLVYSGREPNGPFREITKAEYDYAQTLIAERDAAANAPPSDLAGPAARRFEQVMVEAQQWLRSNGMAASVTGLAPATAMGNLDLAMGFAPDGMSEQAKAQGRAIWDRAQKALAQLGRTGAKTTEQADASAVPAQDEQTEAAKPESEFEARKRRDMANDQAVDRLTDDQVRTAYEAMALPVPRSGTLPSVNKMRDKIKDQHPDDVEAGLAAAKKLKIVPVGNDAVVIPSGNETEADQQDTGADIPRAFFKKVKVSIDVMVDGENTMESVELPADKALKSVREDIANYQALIKCMKG